MVLFKLSGERIAPMPLNLFKNTVGLVLLGLTLVFMGEGASVLADRPREDVYILVISGFLGIALADTVFFHALNLLGVGLSSIVDCLYSPFVILCAFLMLSEALTVNHYFGGVLVLAGVAISSKHPPPAGRTRLQLLLGIGLGALALALMAVGIVLAKPVLDVMNFPLIWATLLRLLAGTIPLAAIAAASSKRKELLSVFRPSRVWKHCLPASVLGAYICMILWMLGFKYTYASVAAILNQTSTLFALVFATLILKEPFTRRKLLAVTLALAGVILVTLNPSWRP
jgi:drug/metabolite transporter (DMT)-like permease